MHVEVLGVLCLADAISMVESCRSGVVTSFEATVAALGGDGAPELVAAVRFGAPVTRPRSFLPPHVCLCVGVRHAC